EWYWNAVSPVNVAGPFTFSELETALPTNPSQSGNPFASFLLGEVDQASVFTLPLGTIAEYWYHGLFVQDDIKWSRNLTINVGLRYELFAPFHDKRDRYSIMDLSVPNPGCGGCPGALIFAGFGPGKAGRRRLTPPIVKDNFEPRIGFAYALKPTLAIRAGYAILDEMPGVAGSNGNRSSSLGYSANPFFQTPDNGLTGAFNWNNGFPSFQAPPVI